MKKRIVLIVLSGLATVQAANDGLTSDESSRDLVPILTSADLQTLNQQALSDAEQALAQLGSGAKQLFIAGKDYVGTMNSQQKKRAAITGLAAVGGCGAVYGVEKIPVVSHLVKLAGVLGTFKLLSDGSKLAGLTIESCDFAGKFAPVVRVGTVVGVYTLIYAGADKVGVSSPLLTASGLGTLAILGHSLTQKTDSTNQAQIVEVD